jgi:hypothetical protein
MSGLDRAFAQPEPIINESPPFVDHAVDMPGAGDRRKTVRTYRWAQVEAAACALRNSH